MQGVPSTSKSGEGHVSHCTDRSTPIYSEIQQRTLNAERTWRQGHTNTTVTTSTVRHLLSNTIIQALFLKHSRPLILQIYQQMSANRKHFSALRQLLLGFLAGSS